MLVALTILVSGLIPEDSGKTWLTLGTALVIRERGLRVSVFKPVAGHNLWYSPRTLRKSFELALLVGNDILAYYEAGLARDIKVSNPIDVATAPPDPTLYASFKDYASDLEDVSKTAVLSRIYKCRGEAVEHYVHYENVAKTTSRIQRAVKRLAKTLGAKPLAFSEVYRYMTSSQVEEDLNKCLSVLEKDSDVVFVESFNDAVTPYGGLLDSIDLLLIVAPGKVLVYKNVAALKEALRAVFKELGSLAFKSMYVVNSLKPDSSFETGFALKPGARRVHVKLFEEVVLQLLKK